MNFNLCAVGGLLGREMAPILWVIHLRMTPGTQISGNYMTLIQKHIEGILHPESACRRRPGRERVHAKLGVEKIKMVIMAGESMNVGTLSCKDPEGDRHRGKMTKKSGTMLCR